MSCLLCHAGPDASSASPSHSLTHSADQWKVLVYDQSCRDVISPLMNVGSLRNKGVTLHLLVSVCVYVCECVSVSVSVSVRV